MCKHGVKDRLNKIKDNTVLTITLYILIVTGLPYFVNPNHIDIDPDKITALMAPLYGTAAVFLVIFYVLIEVIFSDKYALFADYLLRLNLFITCLLLLLLLHPFGDYNLFISNVTGFVIWNCYILVILLMFILLLNFIDYIKGKAGKPMKN